MAIRPSDEDVRITQTFIIGATSSSPLLSAEARGGDEMKKRGEKKIIDRRSCENRRTLKVQGNHLKKKSVNKVPTSCRFIYLFVLTAKYVYKFNKV